MAPSLPGGLRHPGDLAVVGELAQTDAAHPELPVHRTWTTAAGASSIGPGLVLRRTRLLDAHGCLGHQSLLSFSVESSSGSFESSDSAVSVEPSGSALSLAVSGAGTSAATSGAAAMGSRNSGM